MLSTLNVSSWEGITYSRCPYRPLGEGRMWLDFDRHLWYQVVMCIVKKCLPKTGNGSQQCAAWGSNWPEMKAKYK